MQNGFVRFCFSVILFAGLVGTIGCSQDIPLAPAEEWRGSYRLVSGNGGQLNVVDPPAGTPRYVIFTAPAAELGTVIFVYNPPLAAPPMATQTYDRAQRRYRRITSATLDNLYAEPQNNPEGERHRWGKFFILERGPRHAVTGELGNDLRRTDSPDGSRGRSPIFFQSPWPREDKRKYRMLMFVPDGFGMRKLEYARDLSTIGTDSLSGTWVLDDGHLNGTWMDPKTPFSGVPLKLHMQWNSTGEITRPSGAKADQGHVDITYEPPLVFATHDGETRFFNSRATYQLQGGVPRLLGSLKGSSSDQMSVTTVGPSDVQFTLEGGTLKVSLNQGGQSYDLEYQRVPQNPQELEGFGNTDIVVEPVPALLF